jgi:class 3 adenylate cyclase
MAEVSTPPGPSEVDKVAAARAAIGRKAWPVAFELLSAADREGVLSGADLEALALCAFFAGQPQVEDDARERAFTAWLAEGDEIRAAFVAIAHARNLARLGKASLAAGWVRRAEQLLPAEGETYAHGYLLLARSEFAALQGDIPGALALADRAVAIAGRSSDADLRAWSLAHIGEMKIASGDTPRGIEMLEEASVAAVNGELTPFTSGVTACRLISACRDLSDYRRASEWIEATERYCRRESVAGFPGVCRVHRAEVAAVAGAWQQAESDLLQATEELGRFRATMPQADGYYAIGEIRRLRGDIEGAEQALREAHALGHSPQPALALIRLAQGRVKAALAAIDAALEDEGANAWRRSALLPAQVEIMLAAGDVPGARAAVDEYSATVAQYPSPATEARRRVAAGRVLIAEGQPAAAAKDLRAGIRSWHDVGAPYEVARARVELATALRAMDDADDAVLELRAALDEFRRLGAPLDAAAVERLLADAEDRSRAPEQVRRVFMFTDIVGSTTLAEALGDAAWERLLRWHDDTLRRLTGQGGGEIVNSTGDGFFVAFPTARKAVDTAIAIQRALRDHRETVGFVPPIRIGLHVAEANRRGMDYSGIGVHVAARVGALAGSGEILATAETLREAGEASGEGAAASREVSVKGVSAPIEVAPVAWS